MKEKIVLAFKGLLMGAADVMPGVSGGTIALITGIYERLIKAISEIDLKFISLFLRGKFKKSFKNFLKIDFNFFIPLGLGIVIAIFSMAHTLEFYLEEFPGSTYAVFFGLILASAIVIFKEVPGFSGKGLGLMLIGFLFAFFLAKINDPESFASGINLGHSLPVIFISAMIAICAMILPGISGSFLLLLMGQYEFVIEAIKSLDLTVIITFCLGALVGILSFSKLIHTLLKKHKANTIFFLIGLMLGALKLPYDVMKSSVDESKFTMLILALIAFNIVIFVERKFGKIVKK